MHTEYRTHFVNLHGWNIYHRVELEAEIRLTVDELMREELKNLKLVSTKSTTMYFMCIKYYNIIPPPLLLSRLLRETKVKVKREREKARKERKGRKE